ncbi:MAG TPA: serine protease [Streptomyces sp.]|nr:serine protease [Streptomyces sp.]
MTVTADARTKQQEQAEAAAERYRSTSAQRRHVERQMDAGVQFPDSPQAIAVRATRLLERQAVPAAAAVESIREDNLTAPAAHERILGLSKELQAWSFLPRGARVARTVARVSARENGRELPVGTGFLVSPRLLMTNHHVLPDADSARGCVVEFDAQITIDNTPGVSTRLDLDPDAFFVADERLDFALVAVRPADGAPPPGEVFGWNRLGVQPGKLVIGEPVNIIGHPMGRLKEIAVRDNAFQVRLEDFLHYRTDTEPGNSGSPVFNDQWEVVALHHSGVPDKDAQGRTLRKDGKVWQQGDGDDAIAWVANEGVRISRILEHLAALPLGPEARALLAGLGPDSGLQDGGAPAAAPGPPAAVGAPAPGRPAPRVAAAPEAATGRPGLRARPTAFGGGRHLVFLHGRSQQDKKPVELRRAWAAGLNYGLTRAGTAPVDPADIWFPYYGDTLAGAVRQQEAVPRDATRAAGPGSAAEACAPTGPARDTYERLVAEAAAKARVPTGGDGADEGLGDAVTGALRRQLAWLAANTDVDEWLIATVLRDVAAYLDDPGVRDAVLDAVLASVPASGELVLVTHSLGTVVGMDLLTRLAPEVDLALLVTAGSPLGLDTVHDRLLGGGAPGPERQFAWVNAWCPTDAVATGCPLAALYEGRPTDLAVVNARGRAHHIEEYLMHDEVAAEIGRRVAAVR